MAGFHVSNGAYFVPKQVQTTDGKSDTHGVGLHQPPTCPECGSAKVWKDGFRHDNLISIQRWLCRDCGYRFSSPSLTNKKADQHILKYQVCADEKEAKNLATVEPEQEQAAGATTNLKNTLFNYVWYMKKQGYAESTIETRSILLKKMVKRGGNLYDPESVKEVISKQTTWSAAYKENAVHAYSIYLKMKGGTWNPPLYKRVERLPWIPTEREIDQLIAGCSRRIGTFLQMLKETGMRPGEAWLLKWIDIDFEKAFVNITPEKHSKPRVLKLSNNLLSMLNALPKNSEHVFRSGNLHHFRGGFAQQRKRIAAKLKNPRLTRITFKTLRHFKATMEYHKTKDILYVKEILGHKNIKNTLVYTHLINFESDEYITKIAKNANEACTLIEAGFDYVCSTPDELMVFRKRK